MSHEPRDTPLQADELISLIAFLERQRLTLEWKCEGLTAAQLAHRAVPPSTLSLLGLVRHMADTERGWFGEFAEGPLPGVYETDTEPDLAFDGAVADDAVVAEAFASWRAECDRSRDAVSQALSLDHTALHGVIGQPAVPGEEPASLRWILLHMIEEYARHCGHADLIRQSIDGAVGE